MKILLFYQMREGFSTVVSAVPKMARANVQHIEATVYNSSGSLFIENTNFNPARNV
jgi:hypothetical protein